jgi:hypothetical protein
VPMHQSMLVEPRRAPYGYTRSKEAYTGPDPTRVKEQLELLQSMWKEYGPKEFMLRFCWIQPKPKEFGERELRRPNAHVWKRNLVPFLLNRIQTDIEANLGTRNIFLKPRQGGYTTYMIIRRLLIPCILNPGHNGLLISQNSKAASDYFRILKRCFNLFGVKDPFDRGSNWFAKELHQHLLHTTYSNRRELVFDQLDLAIRCDSAEVEEVGQGYTYAHVVASEVARWEHNPEATLANLKESIPKNGTFDMESTANGWGGYFFEECMRARDKAPGQYREFTYHFHEWFWHEEYYDTPPVNPETYTKEEHKLVMQKDVSPYQITWRRKKKEELRNEFDEKYPEDDISCFLLSGQQYFDKELVKERRQELVQYTPREKYPKLQIFKKEKPHHNYIIGADVASGLDVSEGKGDLDWSVGQVLDEESGEQVAIYRAHVIPEEFGWDLADLGRRYNDALIGVERNEDGGTVILTLETACMYGNLYKHIDWTRKDRYRQSKKSNVEQNRMIEILGFPTNAKTRPLALNRARFSFNEHPELIHDIRTVEEMATFVRDQDKAGRPAASPGTHDDCVLSLAIAHYIRNVRLGYLSPETLPRREKYAEIPFEFREDDEAELEAESS